MTAESFRQRVTDLLAALEHGRITTAKGVAVERFAAAAPELLAEAVKLLAEKDAEIERLRQMVNVARLPSHPIVVQVVDTYGSNRTCTCKCHVGEYPHTSTICSCGWVAR